MHFLQLGEADGLPRQPLDPRPQGQVLPLDPLGVPLSNHMLFGWQVAFVGTQAVGVEPGYPKRRQQFPQFQKNRVFPVAEHIGKDLPRGVVKRMPKPALGPFVADVAPHPVQFGILNPLNVNGNIIGVQGLQELAVDGFEALLFFFSSLMTVFGLTRNTRAVSRMPLPLSAMSIIRPLTSGRSPL